VRLSGGCHGWRAGRGRRLGSGVVVVVVVVVEVGSRRRRSRYVNCTMAPPSRVNFFSGAGGQDKRDKSGGVGVPADARIDCLELQVDGTRLTA
jgi:hypothetical protein